MMDKLEKQIEKLRITYYESKFEEILESNTKGYYGEAILTKSIESIAGILAKVVTK